MLFLVKWINCSPVVFDAVSSSAIVPWLALLLLSCEAHFTALSILLSYPPREFPLQRAQPYSFPPKLYPWLKIIPLTVVGCIIVNIVAWSVNKPEPIFKFKNSSLDPLNVIQGWLLIPVAS